MINFYSFRQNSNKRGDTRAVSWFAALTTMLRLCCSIEILFIDERRFLTSI